MNLDRLSGRNLWLHGGRGLSLSNIGDTARASITLGPTRSFWLVSYAVLILFVGTTIPTPLYRVYQDHLGFSSGTLTLIFAVYVLALVPSLLLFGQVSDQVGRRPAFSLALGQPPLLPSFLRRPMQSPGCLSRGLCKGW